MFRIEFDFKKESGGGPSNASNSLDSKKAHDDLLRLAKKIQSYLQDHQQNLDTLQEVDHLTTTLNGIDGLSRVIDNFKEPIREHIIAALLKEAGELVHQVNSDSTHPQANKELKNSADGLFALVYKLTLERLMLRDGGRSFELESVIKDAEAVIDSEKMNIFGSAIYNYEKSDKECADIFPFSAIAACLTTGGIVPLSVANVGTSCIVSTGAVAALCCLLSYITGGKEFVAGARAGTQTPRYRHAINTKDIASNSLDALNTGENDQLRQQFDEATKILILKSLPIQPEVSEILSHTDVTGDIIGGPKGLIMESESPRYRGAADAAPLLAREADANMQENSLDANKSFSARINNFFPSSANHL